MGGRGRVFSCQIQFEFRTRHYEVYVYVILLKILSANFKMDVPPPSILSFDIIVFPQCRNFLWFYSVLRIQIRWIRKILAYWIRIQGVKYQPKTAKKNFLTPKTQIWIFEIKRRLKIFPHIWIVLGGKNKRKNKTKNLKIIFC